MHDVRAQLASELSFIRDFAQLFPGTVPSSAWLLLPSSVLFDEYEYYDEERECWAEECSATAEHDGTARPSVQDSAAWAMHEALNRSHLQETRESWEDGMVLIVWHRVWLPGLQRASSDKNRKRTASNGRHFARGPPSGVLSADEGICFKFEVSRPTRHS